MADGTGVLTKPLMFLSSYAPLFVILAIRFETLWLRIACISIAAMGIAGLFLLMHFQHTPVDEQGKHHLLTASPAGEGASSYLAGYLLPFVTVGTPSPSDLTAYAVFFLVAYLVHARTEIIRVNPALFLFGWKVYAVTDCKGFQGHLISRAKEKVVPGAKVFASRMTGDLLLLERVSDEPPVIRSQPCQTNCP